MPQNVENLNDFVVGDKLNSLNYNNFYQNYTQHYQQQHHQHQTHQQQQNDHYQHHYDWRRNCHTPHITMDKSYDHLHQASYASIKVENPTHDDEEVLQGKSNF